MAGRKRKSAGQNKKASLEGNNKEEDSKFEVEAVVDDKIVNGSLHYLIHWKGYSADDDTWEPENTLNCPDLVKKYIASKKKSPKKEQKQSVGKRSKKNDTDTNEGNNGIREPKNKRKSTKVQSDDSSEDEFDGKEFEVKSIIEVHHCRNGTREFLVRWKGFGSKDDTWEPEKHLNCPDLIEKFMSKLEKKVNVDNRELRINRAHTDRFSLPTQGKERRLSKRFNGKQRVYYHEAE